MFYASDAVRGFSYRAHSMEPIGARARELALRNITALEQAACPDTAAAAAALPAASPPPPSDSCGVPAPDEPPPPPPPSPAGRNYTKCSGVKVVGEIPSNYPTPAWPAKPASVDWTELIVDAASITIVVRPPPSGLAAMALPSDMLHDMLQTCFMSCFVHTAVQTSAPVATVCRACRCWPNTSRPSSSTRPCTTTRSTTTASSSCEGPQPQPPVWIVPAAAAAS